ncbi:MFS transporter [Devosia rhodophyticola]|uniref:MFS transporter n=1 Tax=Devosia rhodophyticola TaxID=3026423 RepID=A0ABY7YVF0_9HYPH|nr:MFS transporter [Devosia rhodophyticola]WDR05346.1 MFS transporter [Devosia rhodophyticola]
MFDFLRSNVHFFRENARWISGGFLLTLFSSFGQTFFIGLSGNDLRDTFGLSGGAFGGIYMLATLASAATLPWLGRSLDVMPGWKVVRFTMPALAFACVLLAVAPNLLLLTAALYLLRLFGQGMMTETAFTETGRWFVANRGRAMALVVIGQQAGSALLPALVVLVAVMTGDWRISWYLSAALVLLVGLPVIITLIRVERTPRSTDPKVLPERTARDWTRSEVLRDPMLYLLLSGTLAPAFIGTSILFHQGYLVALRGYDPLAFAIGFPIMSVTTVVFGLVCGHLVDRLGSLKLLPIVLLPLAVASLAVGLVEPVWGVYAFMLLLGVSNGFTSTLLGALWPEVYGLANLGGIRAIVVSGGVLASALGPGITGALIDLNISLPNQMLWMAAWCILASLVLAYAAKRIRLRETEVLATIRTDP